MSRFLVGTSGYSYQHWKGVFYPAEVKQPHWLEYYAQHYETVELNVTYYNLPKREAFEHWRERTPEGFRFAVKGSRLITHYHRLKDVDEAVATFFERAHALGDKLEVVLWQLPARVHAEPERLDAFCALVRETSAVRQAFEFRDDSWFAEDVYDVLRKNGAGLCVANSPSLRTPEVLTADFAYLRFHGGRVLYGSQYSDEELRAWGLRARRWLAEGTDVYAYFNNDVHGFAVGDAARLRALVEGTNDVTDAVRRPLARPRP